MLPLSQEYLNLKWELYSFASSYLALVLLVLGIVGIVLPGRFRDILKALPRNRFRLPLGLFTALTGSFLAAAPLTASPAALGASSSQAIAWRVLAGFLALATLAKGLTWLAAPGFVRQVVTFHTARSDAWHRTLGVICVILSWGVLLLLFPTFKL